MLKKSSSAADIYQPFISMSAGKQKNSSKLARFTNNPNQTKSTAANKDVLLNQLQKVKFLELKRYILSR